MNAPERPSRQEPRAAGAIEAMDGWWHDARIASRVWRRSPAFSWTVVVTLALGIGANAAIFAVVDAVLLRPLPYPAAPRLVRLWETRPPASGAGPGARPQRSPRISVPELASLRS